MTQEEHFEKCAVERAKIMKIKARLQKLNREYADCIEKEFEERFKVKKRDRILIYCKWSRDWGRFEIGQEYGFVCIYGGFFAFSNTREPYMKLYRSRHTCDKAKPEAAFIKYSDINDVMVIQDLWLKRGYGLRK